MNAFNKMIGRQFSNPHGFIGRICCKIMNVVNKKMYKSVIDEISADSSSAILDVGYGNGYLLNKLYNKFGCSLFGIEVSTDAEKLACKRNKKGIARGKIKLMQADCCKMPFKEQAFDFVGTVNTIYFWEDTLKGLSEIHRVLKVGGVFYNAVYGREWLQSIPYTKEKFKFFEKEDYVQLGKTAGFREIEIKEIKKGKSFLAVFTK